MWIEIIALSLILAVIALIVILSVMCFAITEGRGRNIDLSDTNQLKGSRWEKYTDKIIEGMEWLNSLGGEDIVIKAEDNVNLHGKYIKNGDSRRTVLFFHGYRSAYQNDFSSLARFYYDNGFNIFLTDQRSHGRSGGHLITLGIKESSDCIKWIEYIIKRNPENKILLSGVSMGAATVLLAAGKDLPDNVMGIVSDCGYTSPKDIVAKVLTKDFRIPLFPVYYIVSFYSKLFTHNFLNSCSALEAVQKCDKPILFFHGSGDTFIPSEMTERLYNAAKSDKKEICIIEGAQHAECYAKDTEKYHTALSSFIENI